MKTLQVKIFQGWESKKLEEDINEFLIKSSVEIYQITEKVYWGKEDEEDYKMVFLWYYCEKKRKKRRKGVG